MNKSKKIFVVGPNKCGTISLHNYFLQNNLKSVHWKNGTIALKILSNISANLNPLCDLDEYNCFLDMYFITNGLYISPLSLINKITHYYPNEIYILNIRKYDDWIKSRNNHGKGSINERLKITFKDKYDSIAEYNGYKKIIKLNLPNFHIFDLDQDDKFILLSKFLRDNGLNIVYENEIHMHKTNQDK